MLYNVMTKEYLVNFKLEGEIRDELRVAAKLRGLNVSALLRSLATEVIRQERERNARAFAEALAILQGRTDPPKGPRGSAKRREHRKQSEENH